LTREDKGSTKYKNRTGNYEKEEQKSVHMFEWNETNDLKRNKKDERKRWIEKQ
tara:strand:+ start:147 stop:305 length:159 start_codon:yes stop_codon:yes gene_type:complete